jgi:putative flippase GtrA
VALDFAIYSVLLSFGVWYQGANAVGYVFGTLLSFALNRVITFKVLDAPGKRLALFLGVASVGYLSSVLSLWLMIEQLEIEPIAAKLVSIAIVVAIQYTLNSRLTFR